MAAQGPGIAPTALLAQVSNTARWALEAHPEARFVRALANAPQLDATFRDDPRSLPYFELLLAAHFTTVATFVPTDVDARIRHHVWQALEREDELLAASEIVDAYAALDARMVSARVIDGERPLSGHAGEWLAVRAGALGRAIAIGAETATAALVERIDDELAHEAAFMRAALQRDDAGHALRVATTLAHNLGDLSRVVEAWPKEAAARGEAIAQRYLRLGHEDASRHEGTFVIAGALNKALTATENHRFLALRKPRALRGGRDLLLPLGPWLDAWGTRVAKLDVESRAEIVLALLETHARGPTQTGCLRALAAMHEGMPGGIDALLPRLPARSRKLPPAVREALRMTAERWDARLDKQYRAALREVR